MCDFQPKICIGFGLGNMSTVTLPFASGLREQGIYTIFLENKNGIYKEIFDNYKEININFLNRENESELLQVYNLEVANTFTDLYSIINQETYKKSKKNILFPVDYINEIIENKEISIVLGFSAVGAKNLEKVILTVNDILKDKKSIPFYLFENLSGEKEKFLNDTFKKIRLKNCVIRRTSGDIKTRYNNVYIKTCNPEAGSIKYEYSIGDIKFLESSDGVSFIPMSKEEIRQAEYVKYCGTNLIDYIIARYVLIKKIKMLSNNEYVFKQCINIADNKIGDFIDSECEEELKIAIEFIVMHLSKLNTNEIARSCNRIDKMKHDTFARILKKDEDAHLHKLHFAQGKSKEIISMYEASKGIEIIKKTLNI